MPRLLLFVPCEKALVGADNGLSLINALSSVTTLTVPPGQEMDDATKATARKEWTIVTVWRREPGDAGRRFEQQTTMTDASGKVRFQAVTEFEMAKTFHRLLGKIPGFPSDAGEYTLAVSLRHVGEQGWTPKGEYPLLVATRQIGTEAPATPDGHAH